MTIALPRTVSSDAFAYGSPPEGCFVACTLMLLIFWRFKLTEAALWATPASPEDDGWLKIGRSLFGGTSVGGTDTKVAKEKTVPEMLRKIGAKKDLVYDEVHPADVVDAAGVLASKGIPSIVFYDSFMLYKGLRSGGSVHTGIFLESHGQTIRLADPSNVGPRGYQLFDKESFAAASAEIPKTLAFFYPKREIRVEGYRPEVSLEKWLREP